MTEREMEDLLWNYPEKLFNEPLKQFSRQESSPVGRSDLIFTDRIGRFLVVEIKRGKLPREAISQLHDYYGMVKNKFPDRSVELMVVANQIPPERKSALDGFDIGWREIPEPKFREIAAECGYTFASESQKVVTSVHPARPVAAATAVGAGKDRRWSFGESAISGPRSGPRGDGDERDFLARCDEDGKRFFVALLEMIRTQWPTKTRTTWNHESGFSLGFYFQRLGFVEMVWGFPVSNKDGKRSRTGQSLVFPFDFAARRNVPIELINDFGSELATMESFVGARKRPSIPVANISAEEQDRILAIISEFIGKAASI